MADTATTRGGGGGRLQRGDLTRELIVRESLRLLDTDGVVLFSLPKLVRALGADATAVYRHFASKDDLVLAVADHLIEESAAGVRPQEGWVETLAGGARQPRRTYLAHPAAASLSSYRTTQGPAEMKAVDIIISCVLAAGFEGAEAAVVYRAIGDFGLYRAGAAGLFLGMDEQLQKNDTNAWTTAYLTADQAKSPAIWRVREHLPAVDDDAIFEMSLSFMLAGLHARAPRPCTCPKHS